MSKIHLLKDATINKIAAGEVIENPAAVVKELIENAVDAGSQSIVIEVEKGGFQLIRISDDGSGMARDDAILSLERHATSKLSSIFDLEGIQTMGFRGEALASVAAISHLRLMTKDDGAVATEVCIEGGKLLKAQDCAREQGTTVEVKRLFYNVPARRKFQKSISASTTQIIRKFVDLGLAHPVVSMELFCDGKSRLKSTGHGFEQVVKELLGEPFFRQMRALETDCVSGFLGIPGAAKSTKAGQYLFVNGRAIESQLLSKAVAEGYGTRLSAREYPSFALQFTFPGEWIDVNVHPQKKEIRFFDGMSVSNLVRQKIAEHFTPVAQQMPTLEKKSWNVEPQEFDLTLCEAPQLKLEIQHLPIVGIHSPYLILAATGSPFTSEGADGMVMLHLARAEARIYAEKIADQSVISKEMQQLALPINLEFSEDESHLIHEHMSQLHELGIGVRNFGDKAFIVDALHPLIEPQNVRNIIDQCIDVFKSSHSQAINAKIIRMLQKNRSYHLDEAKQIVYELLKCKDQKSAPDGKAIFTHLELTDVERLFKKG